MLCPACLTDNLDTASSCNFCGNSLGAQQGAAAVGSPLQLASGTLLKQGSYEIKKTLGQGGFGITYSATDRRNNQTVAIKELLPEKCARRGNIIAWPTQVTPQKRREQIEEVRREAQFLSQCIHPNIVKIYDCFEENETAYIVMQMAVGESLTALLRQQKKLPEAKVKHYFLQVGEALKEIHSRNLLHRDINPNNIMVDSHDNIILIDFGNAREFIAGQSRDMTRTITPGYAPLEQYSQRAKRGPATDFYAVCATMYELLTGELPPEPTERLQTDLLKSPRQLEPSISPLTEQIILSGLKIRAEDRFQTADELIQALQGKFVSPNLRQARSLVEQGKLSDAASAYDRCLASEPSNSDAAIELTLVLIHLNDSRTEASAQRAIQLNPKDGRGYGVMGLVNCRRANWQEAVKQLQQGTKLASTESWIQANLGWALGMMSQWQQAEVAIEQALQYDNQQEFALGLKAWIAVHQQQWKTAIAASRRCITQSRQADPRGASRLQSWVYPCLTIALYEGLSNKQAPDINRCLQEFINSVPNQAFASGFKGWLSASQNQWPQAIQSFEQATQNRSVMKWIYYNLGISQEQIIPLPQVTQYYERLNQQSKEDGFVLFRLGTILGQQGQWKEAQTYLQKAVQLQPDCAEVHHNLGWVLLNLRKQDSQGKLVRDIFSAYRKASALYTQKNQHQLAGVIQQAFQDCNIEL
jgi:eukaryotic-like serine/threonine-protein kinase